MVTLDPSIPSPRPMDQPQQYDFSRPPPNLSHTPNPPSEPNPWVDDSHEPFERLQTAQTVPNSSHTPPNYHPELERFPELPATPHEMAAFDMHQMGDAMEETNPFRKIQQQRTGQSAASDNPWQASSPAMPPVTQSSPPYTAIRAFSPIPSSQAFNTVEFGPPPQPLYSPPAQVSSYVSELPTAPPLERTLSNSTVGTVSTDNSEGREERRKEEEEAKHQEFLLNEIAHGRGIAGPSGGMNAPMNEDDELLPGLPSLPRASPGPVLPKKMQLEAPMSMEPPGSQSQQPQGGTQERREQAAASIPQETYQIKHIRYWDNSTNTLRKAAILMQNENGPCPLIALVNVLTMSQETLVLADALRLREQLSLELLLSVVCEELVLRGSYIGDLSELHKFLLELRQGMNVNPQFIGDEMTPEDFLHGANVAAGRPLPKPRPGEFVHTKEMELYNAFNIPLVHGWLPAPTSPFFSTLIKYARNFETAQDVILQQQYIIERTSAAHSGMTPEENDTVNQASEVQLFLESSATQLTPYGYDVLEKYLLPGSWSIFFRNDHFGALYKHPVTSELYTLVTDQGYSSYEEIVWESLVDGSGRGGSYFSGDFRPVGDGQRSGAPPPAARQAPVRSTLDPNNVADVNEDGWEVVQSRRPRANQSTSPATRRPNPAQPSSPNPALPPRRETLNDSVMIPAENTTDYDLALALHLQQEEDDQAERLARERRASNSLQIGNTGPSITNRHSSRYQPPPMPPPGPVPVPDPVASAPARNPEDVDPPPRYERVQSNTIGPGAATWQQQMATAQGRIASSSASGQSAYGSMAGGSGSSTFPGGAGQGGGRVRRRSSAAGAFVPHHQGHGQAHGQAHGQPMDKEKCVVM